LSTPFQNRLVGTVIVAAAVIIFLPNLLDGKKKSNQTDFEKIPLVPTFNGKMDKKPFPEQKLVIKDKAIIFHEQAQDGLLQKTDAIQNNSQNSNTNNQTTKTKVTPASKAKNITANSSINTSFCSGKGFLSIFPLKVGTSGIFSKSV
jgi:DedD protein